MKNFLIIVLAAGLAGAAFLTRPDREEFERYLSEREKLSSESALVSIFKKDADRRLEKLDLDDEGIEFKDFYLWTVVREKDGGRTLYTGVFDRWIDNELLKQTLPS